MRYSRELKECHEWVKKFDEENDLLPVQGECVT